MNFIMILYHDFYGFIIFTAYFSPEEVMSIMTFPRY